MINFFGNINPIFAAFLAGIFTWFITMLGASVVFFFKRVNKNLMDIMLSFAGGVMLAASSFSLINPAISFCDTLSLNRVLIPTVGVLIGGLFLYTGDVIFDRIAKHKKLANVDTLKKNLMLISSITLHNIPEGLVIGTAFGSILYNIEGASIYSCLILAIGIGIQNFPEGSSVSLPLLRSGMSRFKAFFLGQLSGFIEPIFAVIGAILALKVRYLLPILLSFAGGCMIYAVVCEIIPEIGTNKKKSLMALFTIIGFALMMILDVALG